MYSKVIYHLQWEAVSVLLCIYANEIDPFSFLFKVVLNLYYVREGGRSKNKLIRLVYLYELAVFLMDSKL